MEIWMFADGNCFFFFHQLVKCHCVLWPVYLYVPFRVIGLSFQRFWKTVIRVRQLGWRTHPGAILQRTFTWVDSDTFRC